MNPAGRARIRNIMRIRKGNDTTPQARCPNDKRVVDHANIQRSRLRVDARSGDLFAVWRDHYHTRREAKESERRGA